MKRDNFDFVCQSHDRIYAEMNRRTKHMKSSQTQNVANFFLINRDRLLTTFDLEKRFDLPRTTILSAIGNLKDIHGFKILNLALKGKSALYKLAGFEEPRGRGHTGRVNSKRRSLNVERKKPETYHALINKVFR